MAEYYRVISEDGIGSVDPCSGLLNAYEGLVKAKTHEDIETVTRAVGTSVAKEKIDIKSALLLVFLAQMKSDFLQVSKNTKVGV